MSILDRLKKTKKDEPKQDADKAQVSDTQTKAPAQAAVKTEKTESKEKKPAAKKESAPQLGYSHRVLLSPVVSEKAAQLSAAHHYVFKVHPRANKVMVKKAIKEMYKVDVDSVRIINVPGKKVRRGRHTGRTKSYKKAVVVVAKGVELPLYEGV